MAVLQAYFDNSDGPANTVCSFGGVVAKPHQWARFSADWDRVLASFGVEPPFHMTDYNCFAKQYARFREDRDRWEQLLTNLIRVIRTNTVFIIADCVVASECVVPDDMRDHSGFRDFRDPFSISMLGALFHLAEAKRDKLLPRGRIDCIFDRDERRLGAIQRNFGHLAEFHSDVFKATCSIGNVRDNAPLQAADIVAFEAMKRVHHVAVEAAGRPQRKSAEALFRDESRCHVKCLSQGAAPELLRTLAEYVRKKEAEYAAENGER